MEFENDNAYPEYKPHITIAYVKEGTGSKYKRTLAMPVEFVPTKLVYSYPAVNGETKTIDIPLSWR